MNCLECFVKVKWNQFYCSDKCKTSREGRLAEKKLARLRAGIQGNTGRRRRGKKEK